MYTKQRVGIMGQTLFPAFLALDVCMNEVVSRTTAQQSVMRIDAKCIVIGSEVCFTLQMLPLLLTFVTPSNMRARQKKCITFKNNKGSWVLVKLFSSSSWSLFQEYYLSLFGLFLLLVIFIQIQPVSCISASSSLWPSVSLLLSILEFCPLPVTSRWRLRDDQAGWEESWRSEDEYKDFW